VIDMGVLTANTATTRADEPAFTQPTLYKKIATHPARLGNLPPATRDRGHNRRGGERSHPRRSTPPRWKPISPRRGKNEAKKVAQRARRTRDHDPQAVFEGSTAVFQPGYRHRAVETGVAPELLAEVVRGRHARCPPVSRSTPRSSACSMHASKRTRTAARSIGRYGEALAFGYRCLWRGDPGAPQRQDCERGTFSQRHAVLYDFETRESYTPLGPPDGVPGAFSACTIPCLSEAAVLGFDYGYSLDYPAMLGLWEGAVRRLFANGAQVIIDPVHRQRRIENWQARQRHRACCLLRPWLRGPGPRSLLGAARALSAARRGGHTSRWSTSPLPPTIFHGLRRQMKRSFRKPLVVMSPKSLLRHPAALSRFADFTGGNFRRSSTIRRRRNTPIASFCARGKIYYDLTDYRAKNEPGDTALVRVEQLYPLHRARLSEIFGPLSRRAARMVPGGTAEHGRLVRYIAPQLRASLRPGAGLRRPTPRPRPPSAPSTSTKLELAALLNSAFSI